MDLRSFFGAGPVNKKCLSTWRKQQKNLKHVWHQVIVTESRKSILPRDWEYKSWEHVFLGKKGGEIWPQHCSDRNRAQSSRDKAEKKYISETRQRAEGLKKNKKKTTTGNWVDFLWKLLFKQPRGEKRCFWELFQQHSLLEIIKSSNFSQVSSQSWSLNQKKFHLNKSKIRNVSPLRLRIRPWD